MEVNVTFRHSGTSKVLQDHIEEKIGKLAKYFIKPILAHVTLNVESSRHIAEITLSESRMFFTAKDSTHDMYKSVNGVLSKLERQLKKYKEKIKNHHKKPKKKA